MEIAQEWRALSGMPRRLLDRSLSLLSLELEDEEEEGRMVSQVEENAVESL